MSSQEPNSSSSTTTSTPLSAIAARRERQRLAAQTASTLDSGSSTKHSIPSSKQNNAASPVNQNQNQSGGSKKKKANKNKKLFLLDSLDDSPSQFIPLDNNIHTNNNPFSISSSKSKPKVSQKSRQKPAAESREEEIDSSQDEDQDQDPKSTRFSTASQSLNSIFKANSTPKSKPKEKESDSFISDKRNRGGICSTFIPRFNHDVKTSRSRNVVRLSLNRGANDIEADKKGKGKQKEGEEQEGLVLGMMKDETLISIGMYSIQVLSGSISINGSSMETSNPPRIVLAPTTNPLPVIKCMYNPRFDNSSSSRTPLPTQRYFNNEASTSSSFSHNPLDLLTSSSFDSIILIKSLPASTRELNNLPKVCSLVGLDPFSFTSPTSTSIPNQTDSESDQDPSYPSLNHSSSRINSSSSIGDDQSLSLPGFKPILSPIQSSSLSTLIIPKGWESALESIENHLSNKGDGFALEDQYQYACQDEKMQIDDEGQENGTTTSRPGVFIPSFNRNYNDFGSGTNERKWKRKSRPPLVVLVKGPKKVGKSTLARLSLERIISSLNSQRDSDDEVSRNNASEDQHSGESSNQINKKVKRSNKVCFLELDLGQGEFGPPGIIGLHLFSSTSSLAQKESSLPIISPNWASSRIPIKAHFFGDTTPRDDPGTYLRFIQDLLSVYRDLCEREKMSLDPESEDEVDFGIPLVINTCGWSKGLGSDLLNQIENISRPSHVFNLEAGQIGVGSEQDDESLEKKPLRRKPYLDHLGHEIGIGSLIFNLNSFESVLKSTESNSKQGSGVKKLNQSDSRTISLMAYFHSTSIPSHQDNANDSDLFKSSIPNHDSPSLSISNHSSLPRYDFSKPLMFSKPYIIDIETGLRGGLHVLDFGSRIENRHKLKALNGIIVGIVLCDAVEGDGERPEDQQNRDHDVNMDLEINSSLENQPTGSDQRQDHSKWWNALTQPLPPIETSTCLGLGIVRSVDVVNNQIHLLTPVSLSAITSTFQSSSSSSSTSSARAKQPKLALVKGILDLPIWASLDFKGVKAVTNGTLSNRTYQHSGLAGVKVEDVPYLDWPEVPSSFGVGEEISIGNGEDTEGEVLNDGIHVVGNKKRKIRRNLMRRSQM